MRKFPKAFARRKSSANVFEELEAGSPVEHTFKVFDRSDTGNKSFDGGVKLAKPPTSGLGRTRPREPLDDNMFENLGNSRGSGASNSNTASTADDSSRLSAASTTPSSTEIPNREEWRNTHDKQYSNIPVPPVPKSTSSFSLKNAGRTLSWGRKTPLTPPPLPKDSSKDLPAIPMDDDMMSGRARAVTSSSYASTATPPKLEERDLGLSLGGDFSDMFSGFGQRKSGILVAQESRAMSQSPDTLPTAPANRNNRYNSPLALNIDKAKQIEESPSSWSSQHSNNGLMANRSPYAPRHDSPPPVPQHSDARSNVSSQVLNRTERPGAHSESGLRRSSALAARRQSTLEYGEAVDEDARLLRESVNASRKLNDPGFAPKVRDSWALPSSTSYTDDAAGSSWRANSVETTPKQTRLDRKPLSTEENMFDDHIVAAAGLAERFQARSDSPPRSRLATNKVMTPAQFERYRQDKERLKSLGGRSREDEEEDEEETYEDEEDDAEKAKALAKLRRKQEAHMAVYRQQMMKVTGEAPSVRPGMYGSQSSPNLLESGKAEEGEEEDEEVPLAILQAHGFPNKNKAPVRSMGSNPNLRAQTQSVVGGQDGRLPVFARKLPQDPYFGAGIQNPMHRESMAFGAGAGSVAGGPGGGLPPGGLVGVIATEERSRAMRRGSPNAQGEYPSVPSNYGVGIPPNRASTTGSMYNGMGPGMGPMGMNPMMMSPGDQAQMQMSHQMQQFMQMQMQFMQMMTSGQAPPQMSQQGEVPRPNSSHYLRPGSGVQSHQRAMTMMEPNAAPWLQHGGLAPMIKLPNGYSPSIAPSERSNVGMPGRYRPVSHMPISDNKSRTSTMMSGALNGWDNKQSNATIKVVNKPENVSDEDDEEGWEEMAKKREKKKSMWKSKTKRDTMGFKDMLHLAQ